MSARIREKTNFAKANKTSRNYWEQISACLQSIVYRCSIEVYGNVSGAETVGFNHRYIIIR